MIKHITKTANIISGRILGIGRANEDGNEAKEKATSYLSKKLVEFHKNNRLAAMPLMTTHELHREVDRLNMEILRRSESEKVIVYYLTIRNDTTIFKHFDGLTSCVLDMVSDDKELMKGWLEGDSSICIQPRYVSIPDYENMDDISEFGGD